MEEKEFWVWMAGFFDGEGTMMLRCRKTDVLRIGYHLGVEISAVNTNEQCLNLIQQHCKGYMRVCFGGTKNSRKIFRWYLSGIYKCEDIIKKIEPWLIVKKQTAKYFLEGIELLKTFHHKSIDNFLEIIKVKDLINQESRRKRKYTYEFMKKYFEKHPMRENAHKIPISKDIFYEYYIVQKLPLKEIAKKLNICIRLVSRRRVEFGFPKRYFPQLLKPCLFCGKLAKIRPERRFCSKDCYIKWRYYPNGNVKMASKNGNAETCVSL